VTNRTRRHRILPGEGTLLVSTDLHGNGQDFRALRELFLDRAAGRHDVHWVLLGDLVHAPDEQARAEEPTLYDYPDESWPIVEGVAELRRQWPDQVHLVLGNHDHGHIGGPRPAKFYADEVGYLESTLDEPKLARLRALFRSALLAVLAPCGVLLAHGSPDDSLKGLAQLDGLSLDPRENSRADAAILRSFLTSYGQQPQVTARLLRTLSAEVGFDLTVVVHGHDRDGEGWFCEGLNQLCPVIFGAARENKRYVELDLSARYETVADLRQGFEIRKLY
jgi:predicted phosphodiesterase